MNRVYGPEPHWRRLTSFAKDVRVDGKPISASAVSRWETGLHRPGFDAVRTYERCVDTADRSLTTMIDTVFRYRSPTIQAAPALTRRVNNNPSDQLNELLEKVSAEEVVTGTDWDELTRLLADNPGFLPVPRSVWISVTRRLLEEIVISDGIFWMQRFEALNRLLAHPTLGEVGLHTIRSVIDDRSAQSVVGTACLYDASSHPSAARDVLRFLETPPDERVFKGTLMACVRKLRYGHFAAPQLKHLSQLVGSYLGGSSGPAETRSLAVTVLRRIPSHLRARPNRAWAAALRDADHLTVYVTDSLTDPGVGASTARRISQQAIAKLAVHFEVHDDPILSALIQEMLFDPVFDARLYAGFLIRLSPYRSVVATALMDEVWSNRHATDVAWLTTLFEALRVLGGPAERAHVERFVVAPNVADAINDAAAYAMGHIGGESTDTFWWDVISRYSDPRSSNSRSESILDRAAYGIGIAHNEALLKRVRTAPGIPAPVRTSAQWWLSRPSYLRESAQS